MSFLRFFLILLCLCLVPLTACVRQQANGANTEVLRQGQLEEPEGDVNIPPTVYVNVRDNTNLVFGLRAQTETWLKNNGYTTVPNPSEAGYILQIVILSAGVTSQDKARAVVSAGYDAPSQLSGKGCTALVADVLLVQRRVPSATKPSRLQLKNISKRNAVASSQMRIALLSHQEVRTDAGMPPFFAETLAKELGASVHKAGTDESQPAPAKGQ